MDSVTQEVKSKLSLEAIAREYLPNLKPSSKSMTGPCPFHEETKPSFHIYPDGHFYCYGCQVNGDVFDFVSRMEVWDFHTTLKHLAEKAGVSLKGRSCDNTGSSNNNLRHILDLAQSYYAGSIERTKHSRVGDYVNRRGLTEKMIERFGVGYAPDSWNNLYERLSAEQGVSIDDAIDIGVLGQAESGRTYDLFRDRLMFPIHDLSGRIVGFGGRALSDDVDPKYINSKDSYLFKKGNILYGLHQARKAIQSQKAINLVEGYTDVLSLVENGYENSAGYLGTAFTPAHADLVARLTSYAYIIPDADSAGLKAARTACKLLLQRGVECFVVILPEKEDVDSLMAKQGGRDIFDQSLRGASHGFTFITSWVNSLSLKDKSQWVSDFLNGSAKEFHGWLIPRLSGMLEVSEFELRRMIKDAPGMFDEEQKVLQFLHSYPAYTATLHARGVEDIFLSKTAKQQWEALLAGEVIKQSKLELEGHEILTYWYEEIKPILPQISA